jgi:Ankyrin repeat
VHQNGMTALMCAVRGHHRRSVERLIDGGANTEMRDKVYNMMRCDVI